MGDSICILFNTHCINNEMCSKNFICVNNKCQCKLNYVNRGSKCLPTYLNGTCENSTDCNEIRFAMCSDRHKCVCGNNYMAVNEKSCATTVGGFCFFDEECASDNSICIDNRCQCKLTALLTDKNQCVPIRLGKPCKRHEDCEPKTNLRCSVNNICVCNSHHAAVNESFCAPIMGGFCSKDKDCQFSEFHCADNKCQCKPNFIGISSRQCMKNSLATSCYDALDCSDPWHAACSPNKKCICKTNHLAINNATCYPILDGYCWNNSQCIIRNSVCSDFQCTCKSDFVAVSDNLCIPNKVYHSL
ncbi:uncharacterized protein DDB_G0272530-like [Microplitis mediator]|uniref:uncharacterized protein DDB_G0272530-like n=1 Tax=Microplitis mediator TaxID=375433 RepID=UPI0025536D1C|nr:uncharacterized protein DDB_G0272530-like [Microplitis mediator]